MGLKSRIFNVMQYEFHPKTGELLLGEEKIKDCLSHRTIKRWAYIKHDKDVYSALDEECDPEHKRGEVKPPHWHIVIEMGSNQVEVGVVAKWLGISDNFVGVAKGAGAFLDCVKYLTHEDEKQQSAGKRLYGDDEVAANFDFRAELDKRAERKLKYGKDLTDKEYLRAEVLYKGLTLREVRDKYPLLYMDDMVYLKKCRLDYLANKKPPKLRINYYITGKGGEGKGLISRALARSMYPQFKYDEDIFFEVGAKGAAFEGYDGQPVIIWNDFRAIDLLTELNGRGNVFNVFDTRPTRQKQSIKYGSVNLCNTVNIVNSIQPFREFLDGLAGEYKGRDGLTRKSEHSNREQSYRRFPMITCLHEEDYDLLVNKGFTEGTDAYDQYFEYKRIQGNFKKIVQRCDDLKLQQEMSEKALEPVIIETKKLIDQEKMKSTNEDAIRAEFASYGKIVEQPRQMSLGDFIDVDAAEVDDLFE